MRSKLAASHSSARAAQLAKALQKIPVAVEPARPRKAADQIFGLDQVHEHAFAAAQLAVFDLPVQIGDGSHLANERRIEADLLHAIDDRGRRSWYAWTLGRGDMHHEDIARIAIVDERKDRQIARIAAVPVELAIDLDRLHQ